MDQENQEQLNAALNTPTDDATEYQDDDSYASAEEDTPPEAEEAEPEAEEVAAKADSEEEEEEEAKPLSRGQQRIQNLANDKRLLEQRAELLERQLELERQTRQQAQVRPIEDENLTELEKWQRQADQTIRQVQMQNADMSDKSDFLMQVSKNPSEAAYIDRVEQRLLEARKQGFNPRREDVLLRLMGEDARSKVKAAPAVKREAAARVKAATGKPVAAKSNVTSSKAETSEFDRLRNIRL